jgi:hypothetical protein
MQQSSIFSETTMSDDPKMPIFSDFDTSSIAFNSTTYPYRYLCLHDDDPAFQNAALFLAA